MRRWSKKRTPTSRTLAAALALAPAVLAAAPGETPALPPGAAEVAELLPGTFVSRDPARSVSFRIAAVPKSPLADGGAVFYLEAARSARVDAPFLQRFLRVEGDGARVVLRVYEPRDLAGVRGKWREPESLTVFNARDVRERTDCRMALVKAPAGHWAGGTGAATCFSPAAEGRLAIAMTLSPQTLEWREMGKGAGEISIFGREREAAAAAAAISSKVKEPASKAPTVLTIQSPSSPSKDYDLATLRGMAEDGRVALAKLLSLQGVPSSAAVVLVSSRQGGLSVFSSAEIFSSPFSPAPALDVSGPAPRLVAPQGRALDDVVAVEVRVLGPSR